MKIPILTDMQKRAPLRALFTKTSSFDRLEQDLIHF
jgi:hypothetical protein